MTVHLLISGKVQGVFFRASTKERADALGIKGWVRNTRDGDVEIMASGQDTSVEKFISWCKIGPASASVSNVVLTQEQDSVFEKFSILR